MPRKKVDNRIRTLIENGLVLRQRSMFVVVGDKARDQASCISYGANNIIEVHSHSKWFWNTIWFPCTHRRLNSWSKHMFACTYNWFGIIKVVKQGARHVEIELCWLWSLSQWQHFHCRWLEWERSLCHRLFFANMRIDTSVHFCRWSYFITCCARPRWRPDPVFCGATRRTLGSAHTGRKEWSNSRRKWGAEAWM